MNKNFRFTTQKRIVYNEVMSRYDHPTAEQIYLSIHEKYPNISKSTVYRNLDVLEQEGLILHIKTSESDHYDLTLTPHYHVLCTECHKVVDTGIAYKKDADSYVSKETGYIIKGHYLIFEGICPECQKKLNETKEIKK